MTKICGMMNRVSKTILLLFLFMNFPGMAAETIGTSASPGFLPGLKKCMHGLLPRRTASPYRDSSHLALTSISKKINIFNFVINGEEAIGSDVLFDFIQGLSLEKRDWYLESNYRLLTARQLRRVLEAYESDLPEAIKELLDQRLERLVEVKEMHDGLSLAYPNTQEYSDLFKRQVRLDDEILSKTRERSRLDRSQYVRIVDLDEEIEHAKEERGRIEAKMERLEKALKRNLARRLQKALAELGGL